MLQYTHARTQQLPRHTQLIRAVSPGSTGSPVEPQQTSSSRSAFLRACCCQAAPETRAQVLAQARLAVAPQTQARAGGACLAHLRLGRERRGRRPCPCPCCSWARLCAWPPRAQPPARMRSPHLRDDAFRRRLRRSRCRACCRECMRRMSTQASTPAPPATAVPLQLPLQPGPVRSGDHHSSRQTRREVAPGALRRLAAGRPGLGRWRPAPWH